MAKQKKSLLHKEIPLEKWLHKHLLFKDDREFALFLVWALFTAAFISVFA
ncbi:MAG: hypothetical protein HYW51_02915 [Candidatus Doudnabacteria bacterium]|nr:hypothetical protein [Candidatus Doudnabacteria bacterium]